MTVTGRKLKPVIADYLRSFHESRAGMMERLTLKDLVGRKNAYMYRATVGEKGKPVAERMLADRLSASTESIFGGSFVEVVAMACVKGRKSPAQGADIEFTRAGIDYYLAIKSGPSAFNTSSWAGQVKHFQGIRNTLKTNRSPFERKRGARARFVVGYFYGNSVRQHDWIDQYSGQDFWTFMSDGNPDLYLEIMQVFGQLNGKFIRKFAVIERATRKRLVTEFMEMFADARGNVEWLKLIEFVSGSGARSSARGRKAKPASQQDAA